MNADDAIVELIKRDAISRADLQGRVFPSVAPQFMLNDAGEEINTPRPYCLIHDQGGEDDVYLDGPGGTPKGNWQVEIWGDDPDSISTLSRFVRLALNGFDGWSGDTYFQAMSATLPEADSQDDDAAPGNNLYVRRFTVTAFYTENVEPRTYTVN